MRFSARSLAKPVVLTVTAALVAGVPALPANARPAHPAHSGKASAAAKAKHDRLTGPRRAAAGMIKAQLKAVTLLNSKAATSSVLTDADRAALQTALTAGVDAVKADLDAVATAPSATALRALMRAAGGTHSVALTQFVLVRSAAQAAADAGGTTAGLAALAEQLGTAAAGGTDVTTIQAAVDTAVGLLNDALTGVPDAVAALLAVDPTATRDALRAAASALRTSLEAVSDAIAGLLTAITDAQTALGL